MEMLFTAGMVLLGFALGWALVVGFIWLGSLIMWALGK